MKQNNIGKKTRSTQIEHVKTNYLKRGKQEKPPFQKPKGTKEPGQPRKIHSSDSTTKIREGKSRTASEIDQIFASTKKEPKIGPASKNEANEVKKIRKPIAHEVVFTEVTGAATSSPSVKRKLKQRDNDDDDWFGDSRGTKSRRTTEDGLPVYDINELNFGSGGDTPLCPFDCNCCF